MGRWTGGRTKQRHRSRLGPNLTSIMAVLSGTGCLSAVSSPSAASAACPAVGAGSARAAAQSIPRSAAPTGVAVGREVTVSWQSTSLSGGTPAAA